MKRQVISILVDGTMQGLQVKPGQGLDLTKFGKATVIRASEIVWDEDAQAWFVDVLQEAGRGPVTFNRFADGALGADAQSTSDVTVTLNRIAPSGWSGEDNEPLLFISYDEAVRAEVAYLDGLRLQGVY